MGTFNTAVFTIGLKVGLLAVCSFAPAGCILDRRGGLNLGNYHTVNYLDHALKTPAERRQEGLAQNARNRPWRPANAPPNTYRTMQQSHKGGTVTQHSRPAQVQEPRGSYWHFRDTGKTVARPGYVAPATKKQTATIVDAPR